MQGKVKWFDNRKGFGFIEQVGKEDIFIYYENIDMKGFKTLNQGDLVEFELEDTKKGPIAKHIKKANDLQTIK